MEESLGQTPDTVPLPAAIYARISKDRGGAGLGVERQEADCRALAERLGWDVVALFVDNDFSAYSGKPRPGYRALFDAVKAGQVRGVLAWHPDRLHRRALELEGFVSLAERHDLQVQTVTAGPVDLSTPSGRMVARQLGSVAQYEVEQTRKRIRDQKRQAAEQGRYRGGPRPYGFEADGTTVRESEADVIRTMATAVLAGRTLAGLARELNERGEITSAGKPWTYARLRDVLIRPRNAGLLSKGRPDRDQSGFEIVGEAAWDAIVEEDTWRAVHALLTDPARRRQDGNDTRWLGSGLYRCSTCGGPMRVAPYGGTAKRKHEKRWLYRCTSLSHLTVSQPPTDAHVRQVVADLVRDPRVVAAMTAPDPDLARYRERRIVLVERLSKFEAEFEEGNLTGAEFRRLTDRNTEELDGVEARIATAVQRTTSSPVLASLDPGQAFLDAPLDTQRAVLAAVLAVEVLRSPKRGAAWTPDRLRLTPVGSEAAE